MAIAPYQPEPPGAHRHSTSCTKQSHRLEMGEPTCWERSVREGCLIFKNMRTEANAFKVKPSDGSARELSVAAGKEIILCGDLVHVE